MATCVQNRTDAVGNQGPGEGRAWWYSRGFSASRTTRAERAAVSEGKKETGKETVVNRLMKRDPPPCQHGDGLEKLVESL